MPSGCNGSCSSYKRPHGSGGIYNHGMVKCVTACIDKNGNERFVPKYQDPVSGRTQCPCCGGKVKTKPRVKAGRLRNNLEKSRAQRREVSGIRVVRRGRGAKPMFTDVPLIKYRFKEVKVEDAVSRILSEIQTTG